MIVVDVLRSVNAYPIPQYTLMAIAEARGLSPQSEVMPEHSKALTLAKGDVYKWLALAPDVSQGGQSFSFTDEQRTRFMQMAQQMYAEAGEVRKTTIYGYKGSRL